MSLFSFFSSPTPAPPELSPHQQRDRLIEGSLSGVTTAEQMLQQAQARKAEVINSCIKDEQADMKALESQMKMTSLRLTHLGNLGGNIETVETPKK